MYKKCFFCIKVMHDLIQRGFSRLDWGSNSCSCRHLPLAASDIVQVIATSSHIARACKHDHTYVIKDSPCTLKRKLNNVIDRKTSFQTKMKYRNAKVCRLQKKIRSLTDVIKELRNSQIISSNCEEVLRQSCSGVSLEVMKKQLLKNHVLVIPKN